LQFIADETECEWSVIYRSVDFLEEEWYAADMIFMTVRDDQCTDALLVLFQISVVRNDVVDAELFIIREFDPRIDDDDLILIFNAVCVLADFPESPAGEYTYFTLFMLLQTFCTLKSALFARSYAR